MSGEGRAPNLGREIHHRIVERGEPLEQVEQELINAAGGLTDDQRAAFWLYAWSLQSAAHQRYEAKRFLRQLEDVEEWEEA
jgi:hypothetical protein